MRKQATNWGKIYANIYLIKGLHPDYIKNFQNPTRNNSISKITKRFE